MSFRKNIVGELEAPEALRRFGQGWISGTLGLALGAGGLPGVDQR
jgi:hypothetical protein